MADSEDPQPAQDPALEDAIDALFSAALGDFIGARNALVKRLKAEGDRDGAARVKAMAKPSVSAWALNQLWWHHRDAFEALRDAGERIRTAAASGAGPAEQAAAGKARRQALTALGRAAQGVLTEAGHAAAAGTLRKLATSLEAAAAHGHAMPEPPLGRCSADLSPPGFESMAGLAAAGFSFTPRSPVLSEPPLSEPGEAAANDGSGTPVGPSGAQRAVARAEADLGAAQTEVQARARDVDGLAREADERQSVAREAMSVHEAAVDAVRTAQRAAAEAEAKAHRAQTLARETVGALDRARAQLREATEEVTSAQANLAAAQAKLHSSGLSRPD